MTEGGIKRENEHYFENVDNIPCPTLFGHELLQRKNAFLPKIIYLMGHNL